MIFLKKESFPISLAEEVDVYVDAFKNIKEDKTLATILRELATLKKICNLP